MEEERSTWSNSRGKPMKKIRETGVMGKKGEARTGERKSQRKKGGEARERLSMEAGEKSRPLKRERGPFSQERLMPAKKDFFSNKQRK